MGVARPFCAALAALQLVFDLLHACHQAPTRVLTDLRMSMDEPGVVSPQTFARIEYTIRCRIGNLVGAVNQPTP